MYGSGPGQFNLPNEIAADGTDVYVADFINQRVQWFTSGGMFLKSISGTPRWDFPYSVTLNSAGQLYVGDGTNHINKLTGFGGFIQSWGGSGTGPGQLDSPMGVATDSAGDVYVADDGNNRVQEFSAYGGFIRAWGTTGAGHGQFSIPWGVAVDGAGNVYVSDNGNDRVEKFNGDGTFVTAWGTPGTGPGQFQGPEGIAVDRFGNVFVADWGNDRIQQFAGDGTFLQSWGTPGTGPGQFEGPTGVAVVSSSSYTTGPSTTIYVTDNSDRVEEFYETTSHTIPCAICK